MPSQHRRNVSRFGESGASIMAQVDWTDALKKYKCTQDTVPDGRWGINSKGNIYLSCAISDWACMYFNRDGGSFQRDEHASRYNTPDGEIFYDPGPDEPKESFFRGQNWTTMEVQSYFDDGKENFKRTFYKRIEDYDDLPTKWVGEFDVYRKSGKVKTVTVEVDEDGEYIGRRWQGKFV